MGLLEQDLHRRNTNLLANKLTFEGQVRGYASITLETTQAYMSLVCFNENSHSGFSFPALNGVCMTRRTDHVSDNGRFIDCWSGIYDELGWKLG
jgi:hypothetical protein